MYINFLLLFISLLMIDLIFYFKISEFKIKKWQHYLSIIIPLVIIILNNNFNFTYIISLLIFQNLLILSFTDYKYYEIDKNSYWILLILVFFNFFYFLIKDFNNINSFFVILSPILIYFLFVFYDKVIDIENLGGADVKLILILSFYFPATKIFSFMIYLFVFEFFLFLFLFIKTKNKKIKVPMICSICFSFFINQILINIF